MSGVFSMGIILFVWAIPCIAQTVLQYRSETTLPARIFSTIRTIAIISIALVAISPNGTGLMMIYKGIQSGNFRLAAFGFELTGVILFAADITLGGILFAMSRLRGRPMIETQP